MVFLSTYKSLYKNVNQNMVIKLDTKREIYQPVAIQVVSSKRWNYVGLTSMAYRN